MSEWLVKYSVVIEADNFDDAEMLSVDIEGDIQHCNKKIVSVDGDPYMEQMDD
jgi:hypothetical protein